MIRSRVILTLSGISEAAAEVVDCVEPVKQCLHVHVIKINIKILLTENYKNQ